MITILGIDGLEYNYVVKFGLKNLKQSFYGKTDLSEFEQPRTMVIWSSILSGKNMEKEILSSENLWKFRLLLDQTFLKHFNNPLAIDVPGFNQDMEQHAKERKAMKDFLDKKITIEEYDKIVFDHHRKVKEMFFNAVESKKYDIIFVYFNAADVIGHMSFGILPKMKIIYKEMDDIAKRIIDMSLGPVLVISDHGMKAIGRFGDHSNHGFWSLPIDMNLSNPKPMDFYNIILNLRSI